MAEELTITPDGFERLLRWLDPDLDHAGLRYEVIRTRLIRMFAARGCYEPELLADRTIDRVTRKIHELDATFEGDRIAYFYKVAAYIYKEWHRQESAMGFAVPISDATAADGVHRLGQDVEDEHECLESCLDHLPDDQHQMIVDYYREQKAAKIEHRRELAERLQISVATLHTRANRIRARLLSCVKGCVEKKDQDRL